MTTDEAQDYLYGFACALKSTMIATGANTQGDKLVQAIETITGRKLPADPGQCAIEAARHMARHMTSGLV